MSKPPADSGDPTGENDGKPSGCDSQEEWRVAFRDAEPGLRKFLSGKLPQAADVDDCLQSVSIAMLNNTTAIPPTARKAWLYRVAANEAALWWRRKATTDRVLEKHAQTAYQVDTEPTPVIETQETVDRINRAIESLTPDARTIVKMRLHDGKTFQTIADELQLPLGTVLTKMRRSMQQLRDKFRDPDEPDITRPNR